jgi:hypothetical protein
MGLRPFEIAIFDNNEILKLLQQAIKEFKKVNKIKAVEFTEKLKRYWMNTMIDGMKRNMPAMYLMKWLINYPNY